MTAKNPRHSATPASSSDSGHPVDASPTSSPSVPGAAAAAVVVASEASSSTTTLAHKSTPTPLSGTREQPSFDLDRFWATQLAAVEGSYSSSFQTHVLPLARIKKVMKSDPDVKMISAEVPVLFAKACELFITEISQRAWVHAEEAKRRTLIRSDVASGISKTDMCDFLIDIVPREAPPSTSASTDTNIQEQQQISNATASEALRYYETLGQLSPDQLRQYQIQLQYAAAVAQLSQGQQATSEEDGKSLP